MWRNWARAEGVYGLNTIDVRGEAYQASETGIDHHTCGHRDHFAKGTVG